MPRVYSPSPSRPFPIFSRCALILHQPRAFLFVPGARAFSRSLSEKPWPADIAAPRGGTGEMFIIRNYA